MSGAIGLRAALEYLENLGMDNIAAYEHELLTYATEKVSAIPGVRLIGTAKEKAGVLSFVVEGIHPTTSERFWIRKASPSAPDTIAPSR